MEKLRSWEISENDRDLEHGSVSLVLYLAKKLYYEYEPGNLQPFMLRLEKWLNNFTEESNQKILISLLSHLFFAGRYEFESLYRSTLTNIYRWLVEVMATDISDPNLDEILNAALRRTWICPITDSLRINAFLKINEIAGHDHRPHWRSLARFGDVSKIQTYIKTKSIERIVLIEDFVGTGTQIRPTVEFACTSFVGLEVALCPLIVCPPGDRLLTAIATQYDRLSYFPAMVLPEEVFLEPTPRADEPSTFTRGRQLINGVRSRLLTEAFGYRQTGALVAMFSNCPDNTLAIFRDEANAWAPLFARVRRPE
jgi:hypothetical protein